VDQATPSGNTPLHYAAFGENTEILNIFYVIITRFLIKAGTKIEVKNINGLTPLHMAVASGKTDIVVELLKNGANIETSSNDGNRPLHTAVLENLKKSVELLLLRGADINARGVFENTPLHIAVFENNENIIELLLSKGANINAKNIDGTTPLHLAAKNGNSDIVNLLLANGADIHAKNDAGNTASRIATIFKKKNIARNIQRWPMLSTIAVMEEGLAPSVYNSLDLGSLQDLADYRGKAKDNRYRGGKRTTQGKRIIGKKTRSNRR
jgi:cytohesin